MPTQKKKGGSASALPPVKPTASVAQPQPALAATPATALVAVHAVQPTEVDLQPPVAARQTHPQGQAKPRDGKSAKAEKPPKAQKPAKAPKAAGGAEAADAAKEDKARKPKMVRDSFTIPKAEYTVLEGLKERAGRLGRPTKKSELLRAGVQALAAMDDAAFLATVGAVPTVKTGRPAKD